MKGAKRFAASDSAADMNDSVLRNKRIMSGSPFDAQRAEPSQQVGTQPLDIHRAESSQRHVRALNNQFASWVQAQLKNHPDELWEDGVQDYLAHASNIMEKFSDVVNWLKANAVKGDNSSPAESHVTEKKLLPENKNEIKPLQEKTHLTRENSTTSFTTSWSTGAFSNSQSGLFSNSHSGLFSNSQSGLFSNSHSALFSNSQSGLLSNSLSGFANTQSGLFSNNQAPVLFSNNQSPFTFGSQSQVAANHNTSDDVDDEELPQPSSPSVKKSEEKGVIVVHEVKCKLYVKSSDPADKDAWKDKGTGQLCIKCKEGVSKGTKESKPTVVVRNDVGKVLLNAFLYPGIKTPSQKNSLVAVFHTSGENGANDETVTARTFLIRLKTEDDRNKLATAIQDYAPAT